MLISRWSSRVTTPVLILLATCMTASVIARIAIERGSAPIASHNVVHVIPVVVESSTLFWHEFEVTNPFDRTITIHDIHPS